MFRPLFRRSLRVLVVVAALLAAVATIARVGPVRHRVRTYAEARLSTALHGRVSLGDLDYNLFRLSATVRDLSLATTEGTPFFSARRVTVALGLPRPGGGPRRISSIDLDQPRLDLGALQRWLASRPTRTPPVTAPRPVEVGHVAISGLNVSHGASTWLFGADVSGLSVVMDPDEHGRLRGRIRLDGRASVRIDDRDWTLDTLGDDLAFDGRDLHVTNLHLRSRDIDARLNGVFEVLQQQPTARFALAGSADVSIAQPWLPTGWVEAGRVDFTTTLRGPYDRIAVGFTATSDSLRLRHGTQASLTASGRVEEGRVLLDDAELKTRGGRVTATLTHTLPHGAPPDAMSLAFSRLPVSSALAVAGVDASAVAATATGTVTTAGPLGRPELLEADLAATLAPAAGSGLPVSGRVRAALDRGAWTADTGSVRVGPVTVAGKAGGALGAAPHEFERASLGGTVSLGVDDLPGLQQALASLGFGRARDVSVGPGGEAHARLTLGGSLGRPTAEGPLEVTQARLGGLAPMDLASLVRLDPARVALSEVTVRHLDDVASGELTYTIGPGRLEGRANGTVTDVSRLLAGVSPAFRPTSGRLDFDLSWHGPLAAPDASGTLDVAGLALGGQRIDRGSASVRYASDIVQVDRLEAQAGAGRLRARARYDLAHGTFALEDLQARQYPVAPYPGTNTSSGADDVPLTASVDVDGRVAGSIEAPEVEAVVLARDVTWHGEAVGEVSATLTTPDGTIRFTADAPRIAARATGSLGAAPDWTVDARVTLAGADVGTLLRIAGASDRLPADTSGTVEAEAVVGGPLARPRELTSLVDVARADLRTSGLELRLTEPARLRVQDGAAAELSASVAAGTLRASVQRRGAQAPFRLSVDGPLGELSTWVSTVGGRPVSLDGTVRAVVEVPGLDRVRDARGEAELSGGALRYADWPPLTEVTASVAIGDGRVTLGRAAARWVSASMTASGEAPLAFVESLLPERLRSTGVIGAAAERGGTPTLDESRARLELAASSLDKRLLQAILGEDALARADGVVDLTVKAEATAPRLEAVTADATFSRAELQLGDVYLSQLAPVRVGWRGSRLTVDPWHLVGPGTDVTLAGQVDFDGAEPAYDVSANGTLDLRTLDAFVSGYLGGSAIMRISARGPASGLSFNGRVDVLEGVWLLRRRNLAVGSVNAAITLDGNRISVDRATGRFNGGSATLSGAVTTGPALGGTLAATLRDVGFELPEGTRHDLDGDLELRLASSPVVSGTVRVRPGTVHNSLVMLAAALNTLQRDPLDVDLPGQTAAWNPRLDIRIATAEDLVFDSNDLRLAAHGDLRLEGTFAEPELRGRASARDDGEVFLLGRTWKIDAGTVDFVEGTIGTEARLAVLASAQVSRYRVQMRVTGPPAELNMSLNSTPPLGQTDLTELVMTGGISSGDSTRRGGEQVAGAISGEVLGTFGRAVGIDAVRVEQGNTDDLSALDLEPVSRLTVAKRLGPFFEVVYSQSLSNSDDVAWVLYYRPGWKDIEGRFTYRTNAPESYEVRQEFEFGGPAPDRARTARRTATRVASVDVVGPPESEAAQLRDLLKLEAGSRFSTKAWQDDEDRLRRHYWERDRFLARIRATRTATDDGRVALRYEISPGSPTVLRIAGYAPDASTIEAMRQTWSRVALEEFLTDELAEPLRLQLAQDGYFSPEVRTVFTPVPPGDGRLASITVSPGQRTGRRQIVFSGNEHVTDPELRRVVAARCREAACWVTPPLLQAPLQGYYRSRGFLSAKVKALPVAVSGDTATLEIEVDEGPRYHVGRVDVTGAEAMGSQAAAGAFTLAPGTPFDTAGYTSALSNLRAHYRRAGYRSVKVDAVPIPRATDPRIDITLTIVEGPRSVLEGVAASGQANVRPGLFNRVVGMQPGGPVDLAALDRAQQRLYDTGIFDSVEVAVEPTAPAATGAQPGDQPVSAVFKLEERPHYRFRYGVQFGPTNIEDIAVIQNSAVPGATVELQRRNLFGAGLNVGAGAFWALNQYRVRATAQTFTFLGRFLQTTATAETVQQDRLVSGDVEYLARSNRLIVEQRLRRGKTRRLELAYGFEVDSAEVELLQPVRLATDRARIAALESTLTWDTRDNPFNPARGLFHSSRAEVSPGSWLSDIAFGRYQLQQYAYLPLGRLTFASGLRFGSLDVNNEEELVGLLLRFTTGGATTVRGYAQDSLVPEEYAGLERCLAGNGAVRVDCGGKVLLVLNEEVRFPIYRWFGGVVFVDAGNTFEGLQQFSVRDLKVGAGAGLRLNTPVLVIRVDVGFPVPREPSGPLNRWYIGIGHAF